MVLWPRPPFARAGRLDLGRHTFSWRRWASVDLDEAMQAQDNVRDSCGLLNEQVNAALDDVPRGILPGPVFELDGEVVDVARP